MKWYVTSLLLYDNAAAGRAGLRARRCHYLIAAENHDSALDKSEKLGHRQVGGNLRFGGVADLLLVHESPEDRAELLWSQIELTHPELANYVRGKKEMRAFREEHPSRGDWYVSSVVLCEVHDEGSHGDRLLVWINSYLIKATNAESAYRRALEIGNEQQDEPGSHRCGGESAHWEFRGIEDIIPVHDHPGDGALLWCDQFEATAAELERMVPKKSDLGVFRWETEQLEWR